MASSSTYRITTLVSNPNLLLPTPPTVLIDLPYRLGFSVVSSAYRVVVLSRSSTTSNFSMIPLLTPSTALSSRRSRSSIRRFSRTFMYWDDIHRGVMHKNRICLFTKL
ncbi:hypothetical protein H5410_039294 [Solanum commersonii]|uniref:Uncharacterized protein n=1 Tax=Solanum commersonii TaxID=4109 RepID=A0A9J5YGC0_SOLCO|nr:hypothetical protein H5410_039294 [Solanum commersonii]